jgi:hypothetical protein
MLRSKIVMRARNLMISMDRRTCVCTAVSVTIAFNIHGQPSTWLNDLVVLGNFVEWYGTVGVVACFPVTRVLEEN